MAAITAFNLTTNNMSIGHYEAYGNALATAYAGNPYGYRGYYTDSETGFAYLRARYYDPATQRFTQEDTYWGDNLQRNLYAYCSGNPVMYTDPSGHFMEYPNKTINHIATPVSVIDLETGITYTDSGRLIWGESIPHGYELSDETIRAARKKMEYANHYKMSNNTKVLEAINQYKTFMSVESPGIGGSDPESTHLVLVDFEVYEINLSKNEARDATQVLRDIRNHNRFVSGVVSIVLTLTITAALTGGISLGLYAIGVSAKVIKTMNVVIPIGISVYQNFDSSYKNDDIYVGQGLYFSIVGIYRSKKGAYFSLSSLISLTENSDGVTYEMSFASFNANAGKIDDFDNIVGYK